MSNKINWKSVFTVMGAILAFNIGTGFATGQEVMQYFSVFGWWSIGAGLAFAATMAIGIYCFAYASERFGLARDQQKMFGVITLANRSNPEWTRCVGVRNSHDQSFAAGICCGVSVLVCSNLCFGGEFVIKRRHTSGIDLTSMVEETMDALADGYLSFEERLLDLHDEPVTDDQARVAIVKAAEAGAIPSCDILAVFGEYLEPRHPEFQERTKWSLLNAFTEIAHKYTPARLDICNRKLTRIFALDGCPAT